MTSVFLHPRRAIGPALLACCALGACAAAGAADLIVRVSGLAAPLGQVGCSLFAGAAGFPMDSTGARTLWLPADPQGVTCRFTDVPEGRYAVAIGHDRNGNRRVDTNLVGLPTEQWGVSNQVRPLLRAPRFDEAAIGIAADTRQLVVDIEVAK